MATRNEIASLRLDCPTAVVGDIHGRADLLEQLLERIGPLPLLVAGDVCDRGPHTRDVIEMLVRRDAWGVRGNHEEWVLAWARGWGFDSIALNPLFGGEATLTSYGVEGRSAREVDEERWRVPVRHREWLASLPLIIDLQVMEQAYWLVHGGVPHQAALEGIAPDRIVPFCVENSPDALLWVHTPPDRVVDVERPVIMGHYPVEEPVDGGHVIAVDTGAGMWEQRGRLTAVILPDREFVTVEK